MIIIIIISCLKFYLYFVAHVLIIPRASCDLLMIPIYVCLSVCPSVRLSVYLYLYLLDLGISCMRLFICKFCILWSFIQLFDVLIMFFIVILCFCLVSVFQLQLVFIFVLTDFDGILQSFNFGNKFNVIRRLIYKHRNLYVTLGHI